MAFFSFFKKTMLLRNFYTNFEKERFEDGAPVIGGLEVEVLLVGEEDEPGADSMNQFRP
jgi:hypothetical protein